MTLDLPASLCLRPAGDADAAALLRIYAGTREEELARTDWSEAQKAAFVAMQFEAQRAHYLGHYPGAEYWLVLFEDEIAGRLYLHAREGEVRIMDIALLPSWRGQGIGTALLGALQAQAAPRALRLSIHVERFNPAQALYRRLGFRPVADAGVYSLMEWAAAGNGTARSEERHEHA